MKKTIVSMVTGALVIGAASTTFAAANPFSDVPANSWAYDAVAKLAADGVVNGFPDGTFRGNENMTRYQMAQIVAKAMTYENLTKADKALVDKLAAEFSNELDNLGVRVSNLEKKSDNVKWTGDMQYTYTQSKSPKYDQKEGKFVTGDKEVGDNNYSFSLKPKAFLGNSGWTANARIKYKSNANSDGDATTKVDRIYVEGPLWGTTAKLGKFATFSDNVLGSGMVMDDNISGAQFTKDNGSVKFNAAIGRFQYDMDQNNPGQTQYFSGTGTYGAIEVGYSPENGKFSAMTGYYTLRNVKNNTESNKNFWNTSYDQTSGNYGSLIENPTGVTSTGAEIIPDSKSPTLNDSIWTVGLGYKFDNNVNIYGIYGKSNLDAAKSYKGADQSKAYDITLNYKGADMEKAGSWGAHIGYRYLGSFASIAPTYDGSQRGTKGFEIGTQYTITQNIMASLIYFDGKVLATDFGNNDSDYKKIYANLKFAF